MSQRELRRHLSMVLSRQEYNQDDFQLALENYIAEHPHLVKEVQRYVKWTTPGVWSRFVKNCWAEYLEWREVFIRKEEKKTS
jgi:hypothetical protein